MVPFDLKCKDINSHMTLRRFVKMHGAGNDFIIVEPEFFALSNPRSRHNTFSPQETATISQYAVDLCRRNFSIGADGLLVVSEVENGFKMSVFNSNGTTAPNCGNGLRCVVAYLSATRKLTGTFKVTTDSGDKEVEVTEGKDNEFQVSINLGSPSPISRIDLDHASHPLFQKYLQNSSVYLGGLGNNHLIVFLDKESFEAIDLEAAHSALAAELCRIEKANVNFCQIESPSSMRIVTCELGAGVTLACGTGSTTSAFVGHCQSLLESVVHVHARGGELTIRSEQREEGYHLHLKGPAKWVFAGEISLK